MAVAGAALAFLPFNITPSRIFLGDGGTMSLGFLIAALVILSLDGADAKPESFLAAPLLFCVPLADAVWRALRRVKAGISLMTAGHDSFADQLQRRGVSPARVGLAFAVAQALLSTVAVFSIRGQVLAVGVAALVAASAGLLAAGAASPSWFVRRVGALLSRE
jgi:UDP-GlcNAc:undecaprenyl-phosphate GlcNAc-1-phosphate transferase